jgi:hypothetical protein
MMCYTCGEPREVFTRIRCNDSKIDYKKTDKVLAVGKKNGNREQGVVMMCFRHTKGTFMRPPPHLLVCLPPLQASVRVRGSDTDK